MSLIFTRRIIMSTGIVALHVEKQTGSHTIVSQKRQMFLELVNRSRKVRWKILIGDLVPVLRVEDYPMPQDILYVKTNNAEILGEEGQIVDHKKRET